MMRYFRFLFLGFALAAGAAEPPASCVFCEIAAGRAEASRVVYRDELVVAFMDHSPRNPGHVLVVPAQHADGIFDVPPPTAARMIQVAQKIAQAIRRTDLKAEGISLQSNTGAPAGQAVFHIHLHVIPRFKGEPPTGGEKRVTPPAELDAVAQKLRQALATEPTR